jgi:Glyoxalase-like domain
VAEAGDHSGGPRPAFHRVAEAKSVENRFHPDLITSDYEGEAERLIALGATRLDEHVHDGARWATFADVEGNEFDLIAGRTTRHQESRRRE